MQSQLELLKVAWECELWRKQQGKNNIIKNSEPKKLKMSTSKQVNHVDVQTKQKRKQTANQNEGGEIRVFPVNSARCLANLCDYFYYYFSGFPMACSKVSIYVSSSLHTLNCSRAAATASWKNTRAYSQIEVSKNSFHKIKKSAVRCTYLVSVLPCWGG